MIHSFVLLVLGLLAVFLRTANAAVLAKAAYTYPGDDNYPSPADWAQLNATVRGNLIHSGLSNTTAFTSKSASWSGCSLPRRNYFSDPSLIESAWWGGYGCKDCPALYASTTCSIGNHPNYIVKALSAEDVAGAVKFAAKHNLRLSVKNTGHDFMGRNLGFGSLSIWTHYMRGIKWSDNWVPTGTSSVNSTTIAKGQSVVTYASGEQWKDVYAEAYQKGKIVTGGTTGTVGAAGGWLQGGGHGFWSNKFGLGVDNVVEFELVIPSGEIVIANDIMNQDLFWALRGGGGGTFGVVTKVTMKAHPYEVADAILLTAIPTTSGFSGFTKGMAYFMSVMPEMTDWGLSGHMVMNKFSFSGTLNAPGRTKAEINDWLAPHKSKLWEMGVFMTSVSIPDGVNSWLISKDLDLNSLSTSQTEGYPMIQSSRLLGREGLKNVVEMEKALQYYFDNGYAMEPFNVAGGAVARNTDKMALNPAWRQAYCHMSILPYRQLLASKVGQVEEMYKMVQKDTEWLDKVSVNSGAYLNEASYLEPEWQKTFWGDNYPRLLQIKEKYDPNNTFWCTLCVGSDKYQLGLDNKLYHPRNK